NYCCTARPQQDCLETAGPPIKRARQERIYGSPILCRGLGDDAIRTGDVVMTTLTASPAARLRAEALRFKGHPVDAILARPSGKPTQKPSEAVAVSPNRNQHPRPPHQPPVTIY